jgi:murein L,D-transpeptidase YcbB/YkuD
MAGQHNNSALLNSINNLCFPLPEISKIMRQIAIVIFLLALISHEIKAEIKVSELIKFNLENVSADKDFKISGEKLHSIEYISNLYAKNDYRPFWTKAEYVGDAISALAGSYHDGLLPDDYHLQAIIRLHTEIVAIQDESEEKISRTADLDLLLTDGIIYYADHLLFGKTDPVTLENTWNFGFAPIPDLNAESLSQYISGREIIPRLEQLRPDMHLYDTLLNTLAQYRRIMADGGWGTVLAGGKIEPENNDSRIPAIRKRLLITDGLSEKDSTSSTFYDKILENDIKAFQETHGLDPDGVIGVGTFRELNVPVEDRIASIRVNLERVRWVAGNMPQKFIIVNIAAFWLMMVDQGEIVHYTPVVVGRPLSKTPVFRDKMRYIEFNPTWTQPRSIVKNETVPKLKKDSTYLEKNHMVLLDSKGNLVSTSSLDFKNLSSSKFPYLVRQEPGPWNALGEVKFMFPNEYDIYLHDTPSKSLFNKASRAYSHGCIRVKNPIDLAVKLLEGTEYDRKKIQKIIETHVTTRVNLPERLDILLMYWTCGVDREGRAFFVPDIYERDMAVLRALDKPMR